jgi:protein phosphatase
VHADAGNIGRLATGRQLTIPNPALVLLVGPSGAGKSTFAARHFSATEIVSSDAARQMLSDDPGNQDASAEAFQILALIVNGRLRRRLTTVIDATNLRATNRKQYQRLAQRYGVPAIAVAFDLSLDAYHARNAGRDGRVVRADVVEDQAARMPEALAELWAEGYSDVVVLDEGDLAAELTIERVG